MTIMNLVASSLSIHLPFSRVKYCQDTSDRTAHSGQIRHVNVSDSVNAHCGFLRCFPLNPIDKFQANLDSRVLGLGLDTPSIRRHEFDKWIVWLPYYMASGTSRTWDLHTTPDRIIVIPKCNYTNCFLCDGRLKMISVLTQYHTTIICIAHLAAEIAKRITILSLNEAITSRAIIGIVSVRMCGWLCGRKQTWACGDAELLITVADTPLVSLSS